MKNLLWDVELLCRDNEPDDGDDGAVVTDDGGDDGAGAGTPDAGTQRKKEKLFTQAEVDDMIVKRNKNLQQRFQELEGSYQKALENKNLTEKERNDLEASLDALKNSQLSEQERAKKEKAKVEEKYKTELDRERQEKDKYKNMFEQGTITRSLLDVAVQNDAYSPTQIVELLQGRTVLVESEDDPSEMVPLVNWTEKTSDGQVLKVQKPPREVVEYMKDSEDYANLFKNNIAQGVGAGTGAPKNIPGKVDPSKISMERFLELKKTPEGRKALGME